MKHSMLKRDSVFYTSTRRGASGFFTRPDSGVKDPKQQGAPSRLPRLPKRLNLQSKRTRVLIAILAGIFCVSTLLCGFASIMVYRNYGKLYQRDLTLAHQGTQQLEAAQTLLKGLLENPFDNQHILQAKQAFTQSLASFSQISQDLNQVPAVGALIPHYGSLFSAASHVAPAAAELSQAGMIGCDALSLLSARFHDPLNPKASGITMADLDTLGHTFAQIQQLFAAAVNHINQVQPSDLQAASSLKSAITMFREALPQIQQGLEGVKSFLALAPTLLGVKQPINYLIEMLDSTELRPGGGFIGNYGILTLAGGRLSNLFITDVDLLDYPFAAAGHTIPLPSNYQWFPLTSNWSLRDSNLDADFPTAARYGEQNYHTEGGTVPVQGVIALTPWLIQNLLKITGPIYVSEYGETITADNLVDRIHYHQLGPNHGSDNIPAPGGHSSMRKQFTELLFEHVLARVQQIFPTHASAFVHLFLNALPTKDLQLYFNDPNAEALLESYHDASTIEAPQGDSFMVVDANITGNKANYFMTYAMQDQVTLDTSGNATHQLTLTYSWPYSTANLQNDYGNKTFYKDYIRIYVPPGSVLQSQSGWSPQGTSVAFGREVWAGTIFLLYGPNGTTKTITLKWMVPGAAKKDASGWRYQYSIQRQAGITWHQNLQITVPSCAKILGESSGLAIQAPQRATVNQNLTRDTSRKVEYTCLS